MQVIRYLARNINPLNILLLIIVIAAAIGVLYPLMKVNTSYSLPQAKPKPAEEADKLQETSGNILPSDYMIIGELNLFHPERRIPVEKKAEEIPKPDLILYGTMIQDNVQYAFIEDRKNPKTTPGRGNRQTTIKKGEVIGGFVVSEIGTDRITLTKGEEKMTVLLTNADKRNSSAGAQRPIQTTPGSPAQTTPGSPFAPAAGAGSPMQQMGGRPTGGPPVAQPPGTVPQPLPRPAVPGSGRGGPGTTLTR